MTIANPRDLRHNTNPTVSFTGTVVTVPAGACEEAEDGPTNFALWSVTFPSRTSYGDNFEKVEIAPQTVYVWRHVETGNRLYADNGSGIYGEEDSSVEKACALILSKHPEAKIA